MSGEIGYTAPIADAPDVIVANPIMSSVCVFCGRQMTHRGGEFGITIHSPETTPTGFGSVAVIDRYRLKAREWIGSRMMHLYEAVAVAMAAALLLLLLIRRKKTLGAMKFWRNRETRDRENGLLGWTTVASPLFLAAIIVMGFALLSARNLTGGNPIAQGSTEHSTAIQNLFFKRR